MHDLIKLWEKPIAEEIYAIAGWHQWADAGAISSGLPEYLIDKTGARKIGQIMADGFYLFQIPGTHHFLRPGIKLDEGYREKLSQQKNEFFYTGDAEKGLVIFLGDEPHLNAEEYAEAFFQILTDLGVNRAAAVGGVYGAMPYDKDRDVSCSYSLQRMKDELTKYAVRFSNYEGGATITSYLLDRAEEVDLEYLTFHAFVPAYDFSEQQSPLGSQGISIENDFKAWYDLMRRFNHMFNLEFDLSDLAQQSEELVSSMETKIDELEREAPQLNIRAYVEAISRDFTERSFMPLGDVWEQGLEGLLDDLDD